MSHRNEKTRDVERYLLGEMGEEEILQFKKRMDDDRELREILERESGVEAAILGSQECRVNDIRFSKAIDRALALQQSTGPRGKRVPDWLVVYAIAATLVLVLLGGYSIRLLLKESSHVAKVASHTIGKGSIAIPQKGKSITKLTDNAVLVTEEGTKAQVIKTADSAINVLVAQGNACFDVPNNNHLEITIATPHMAVTLNSAVVRLIVTELETEIVVLDGSAEVVHRYSTETSHTLLAGNTGFADYRLWKATSSLTPEVCENKTALLRTYVDWVRKQAHG